MQRIKSNREIIQEMDIKKKIKKWTWKLQPLADTNKEKKGDGGLGGGQSDRGKVAIYIIYALKLRKEWPSKLMQDEIC